MNFMDELKAELKKKNLADTSIDAYIKTLKKLNNDNELKNLDFLKKEDDVEKKLEKYKENTKRNFYIAICSSLHIFPKYKKIYNNYFKKLKDINTKLKGEESNNIKTRTQSENWTEWEDVLKIQDELLEKVKNYKKKVSPSEYLNVLKLMALSLFTLQPPRRNKDYLNMMVVKNEKTDDPKLNFLNMNLDEFVFNDYKTVKKFGPQIVKFNQDLDDIIHMYLKYHPLITETQLKQKKQKINVPFLVNYDGKELNKVNGLTYLFNSIFDKKTSSSILRHSYLSHKYSDTNEEQKKDAEAMGHSTSMQKDYIKKD